MKSLKSDLFKFKLEKLGAVYGGANIPTCYGEGTLDALKEGTNVCDDYQSSSASTKADHAWAK